MTVIILGPTASGKTKYAVQYAKERNGEIISADSMQVYMGMDIGTAKPTLEEREGIPHYLIDVRFPDEEWTASDFVCETNHLITEIEGKGKLPIIAGGTGLYLWALIEGFSFPITPANHEIREQLEKEPLATLYSLLSTIDPPSAEKIHPNDKKRIIRALEVYETTGKPISELQRQKTTDQRLQTEIIGLNVSKDKLYQRIEERVDKMLKNGLIEEGRELLKFGYDRNLPSMQALGYKEAIDYLDNKFSYEELSALIKKNTRHFARRQMVWFRRFANVNWIELP